MSGKLVVDLGAHNGLDSLAYLEQGFRVVAVEPNPSLASRLRHLGVGRPLIVEEVALSESDQVTLFIPEDPQSDVWATTNPGRWKKTQRAFGTSNELRVKGMSLSALLDRHQNAYYVKCDIEGSDVEFVAMLADSDHRPPFISFEVPETFRELRDAITSLRGAGYVGFALRDQRFSPCGTSGKFGGDIPMEEYMPSSEFLARSRAAILRNSLFGQNSLLNRFRLYAIFRRLGGLPLIGQIFYSSWYDCHARLIVNCRPDSATG